MKHTRARVRGRLRRACPVAAVVPQILRLGEVAAYTANSGPVHRHLDGRRRAARPASRVHRARRRPLLRHRRPRSVVHYLLLERRVAARARREGGAQGGEDARASFCLAASAMLSAVWWKRSAASVNPGAPAPMCWHIMPICSESSFFETLSGFRELDDEGGPDVHAWGAVRAQLCLSLALRQGQVRFQRSR